jgi:hypothetical protein
VFSSGRPFVVTDCGIWTTQDASIWMDENFLAERRLGERGDYGAQQLRADPICIL